MLKNQNFFIVLFCFMSLHGAQISWAMDAGEEDSTVFTTGKEPTSEQLTSEQLAEEQEHARVSKWANMSLKDKFKNIEIGRNSKNLPATKTSVSFTEAVSAILSKPKADDAAITKAKILANPDSEWYDVETNNSEITDNRSSLETAQYALNDDRLKKIAAAKNSITGLLNKIKDEKIEDDLILDRQRLVHAVTSVFPEKVIVSADHLKAQDEKTDQAVKAAIEILTQPYRDVIAGKGDPATINFLENMPKLNNAHQLILQYLQDPNKQSELFDLLKNQNLSQANFLDIMWEMKKIINDVKLELAFKKAAADAMKKIDTAIRSKKFYAVPGTFLNAFPEKLYFEKVRSINDFVEKLSKNATHLYDTVSKKEITLAYPSDDWSLIASIPAEALKDVESYVEYLSKNHRITDLYGYLQGPVILRQVIFHTIDSTIEAIKDAQKVLQDQNPYAFAMAQAAAARS